jgi:hypothetical protein
MTRLADVQFLLLACTIRLGNRSSYNDLNLTRVYPSNAQSPTLRLHLQPPIILIRSSSYDSPSTPHSQKRTPPHCAATLILNCLSRCCACNVNLSTAKLNLSFFCRICFTRSASLPCSTPTPSLSTLSSLPRCLSFSSSPRPLDRPGFPMP